MAPTRNERPEAASSADANAGADSKETELTTGSEGNEKWGELPNYGDPPEDEVGLLREQWHLDASDNSL